MTTMNILYISIEGNTRAFLHQMQEFAKQQNILNPTNPLINLKEIGPQDTRHMNRPPSSFSCRPTSLVGTGSTAATLKS